jgi:hypothetical protein
VRQGSAWIHAPWLTVLPPILPTVILLRPRQETLRRAITWLCRISTLKASPLPLLQVGAMTGPFQSGSSRPDGAVRIMT